MIRLIVTLSIQRSPRAVKCGTWILVGYTIICIADIIPASACPGWPMAFGLPVHVLVRNEVQVESVAA
jgi:hypothetical protein